MTLTVELTLEQIAGAIRRLPPAEKVALLQFVTSLEENQESTFEQAVSQLAESKSTYVATRAELDQELAAAAEALLQDYVNDKELTAFTALDAEGFYAEE